MGSGMNSKFSKTASDHTQYPNIFKGTYWGSSRDSNCLTKEIIDARNAFVSQFRIVRGYKREVVDTILEELGSFADHTEVYKTSPGGFVVVVSPYCSRISDIALSVGFRLYTKLYTQMASTFIAHFENRGVIRYTKAYLDFLKGKPVKTPRRTLGVFAEELVV